MEAVNSLAYPPRGGNDDRDPLSSVSRLIRQSVGASSMYLYIRFKQLQNLIKSGKIVQKVGKWLLKKFYVFIGRLENDKNNNKQNR